MKNKELIKILEILDPEEEVYFHIYNDEHTRKLLAKASVIDTAFLTDFKIASVNIERDSDEVYLQACFTLTLDDEYLPNIVDASDEFNNVYKRKEQNE